MTALARRTALRPKGSCWTHQAEHLRTATRRTLASSGINKVRMCLLPKAYAYNTDEPELYPFPGSPATASA
ncbi:hypothetical protein ABZS88_34405 [Streptomyces sp. NPDC005480]|uniref:hypothetical protein n=1 Tax=Streptomyces sp. NPDC005480 TaxID=3154880 RepID=UPI0033AE663F